MPRALVPGFVGGSNRLISRAAGYSQTVNWFPETGPDENGKPGRYLRPSEGLYPFAQFDDVDTSAMLSEDGRTYVACGTTFGEVLIDGSTLVLGTIAYDGTPASMASNGTAGNQVMVTSAKHVYIYNTLTDVFVEVDFGGRQIVMCEFMDGYFFALKLNSRTLYYSALEDGTSWDFDPVSGNVIERSWGSDNISFIKRTGRQLFIIGTKTGEVWSDSGNSDTPFAPIQGVFLDQGCIAPFSGQRDGLTLVWLNQDERGGGLVVRANGYTPEAISTYSVDAQVQRPGTVTLNTAEAFVHQITGHLFYWLHLDGLLTTPVLDLSEKEWSERGMWSAALGHWIPHLARCHAYSFERHLVGVRSNGVIYELSPRFLTDGIAE